MIEILRRIVVITVMLRGALSSEVKIISDSNFSDCLQGEWMLELYVSLPSGLCVKLYCHIFVHVHKI